MPILSFDEFQKRCEEQPKKDIKQLKTDKLVYSDDDDDKQMELTDIIINWKKDKDKPMNKKKKRLISDLKFYLKEKFNSYKN